MEKTSIIQAVFSDLGLTVVVQEASRRQMTLTTWCELGHCSKHPLNHHRVIRLLSSTHGWPWICQRAFGFGNKSDDFFSLLLSIPFGRQWFICHISVSLCSPSKLRDNKQNHEAKRYNHIIFKSKSAILIALQRWFTASLYQYSCILGLCFSLPHPAIEAFPEFQNRQWGLLPRQLATSHTVLINIHSNQCVTIILKGQNLCYTISASRHK